MRIFLNTLLENFFAERSRWFSWVSVLFALGIGVYFVLPFEPSIWISLILFEAMLVVAYLCRLSQEKLLVVAAVFITLLGFIGVQLKANYLYKPLPKEIGEKVYIKGKIAKFDYNYRGMPRLILEDITNFEDEAIEGKVRVVLSDRKTDLKVGQCAEMIAELKPPLYPAIVGGYQFSRKMYFQGITASGFVMSRALPIDCEVDTPIKNGFSSFVANMRFKIVEKIDRVLQKDEASIASAIVAGQRGLINEKLYNQYRDSGLAHFLSISGLHMSMIAGLMFFFIRFIAALIPSLAVRYDSKKIAAVFAIIMSFLYLLISGAEIPSKRAFIMTTIVLLGVLCSRTAISMMTISWAALIVLIISPEALVGPSFQMSFAAVICLIAFYERFAATLHRFLNGKGDRQSSMVVKFVKIIWVYMIGILVADLVASLATLPFAIYHFNRIALFTTLGNLLAGPVIALIIMPFVLFSLMLMPLGLEYYPLKVVGWGVEIVNDITFWVSNLPNAGYQVVSMPLWGLILIVFGGLWLCIWTLPWRKWGWAAIVIGALSIFTVRTPDVIVNAEANLFAVKTLRGELIILPSRGNKFDKKMWIEKSASKKLSAKQYAKLKDIYKGKSEDRDWVDLSCNESFCVYKDLIKFNKSGGIEINNEPFDTGKVKGASLYINRDQVKVKTVKSYTGNRFWVKEGVEE